MGEENTQNDSSSTDQNGTQSAPNDVIQSSQNNEGPDISWDDDEVVSSEETPTTKPDGKAAINPETKPAATENKPVALAAPVATAKATTARDLSQFEESDREHLKRVPNSVFDYLKNRLPELYEYKKRADELQKTIEQAGNGKPSTFVEHPQGYMLTEQYQSMDFERRKAEFEEQFYRDQIQRASQGLPINVIRGWNERGQPVYNDSPIPTEGNERHYEMQLQLFWNRADSRRSAWENQCGQVQNAYSNSFKQSEVAIEAERAKRFGFVKEPDKFKDFKSTEGKSMTDLRNEFTNLWPPHYRQVMPTRVGADLYCEIERLKVELAKAKHDSELAQAEKGRVQKVTPTVRSSNPIGSGPNDKIAWDSIDIGD